MSQTATHEKPILFSGEMVRAILAGKKTQTRRVMKTPPERVEESSDWWESVPAGATLSGVGMSATYEFPGSRPARWFHFDSLTNGYIEHMRPAVGKRPTKRRAIKSAMWQRQRHDVKARWSESEVCGLCPYGLPGNRLWVRETWTPIPEAKPSGYFTDPKWKDRVAFYAADNDRPMWAGDKWRPSIFMPRAASRITLEVVSIRVERVQSISEADAEAEGVDYIPSAPAALTHRTSFARLWDKINGKRAPWESNPWVWCITFKRIEQA